MVDPFSQLASQLPPIIDQATTGLVHWRAASPAFARPRTSGRRAPRPTDTRLPKLTHHQEAGCIHLILAREVLAPIPSKRGPWSYEESSPTFNGPNRTGC